MRRSHLCLAILLAALAGVPAPARAQSMLELFQTIRNGGGWVQIPIQAGKGSLESAVMPTGGMSFQGCVQVYAQQSGQWHLSARDKLGSGTLEMDLAPGQSSRFSYQAGAKGQIAVDVRWSEPRDTTLLLWVGLESPLAPRRDSCQPVYGG